MIRSGQPSSSKAQISKNERLNDQKRDEDEGVTKILKDRLGKNSYEDVKDFNQLKTLVPSPNFVVIDTTTLDVDGEQKTNENAESMGDGCYTMWNDMTEASGDVSEDASKSSDDEDEL